MNIRRLSSITLFVRFVGMGALAALAACSSDDASSGPSTAAKTVVVRVTAAAGGSVEDEAGHAKLVIPAGALESDTDITLAILPKSGGALVDVADFGPDGLEFLRPVTLELKADAALAGDESLVLAVEEEGTFKELPGSTYANGVAKGDIEHFSKYSVIRSGRKVGIPSECLDAYENMKGCGGDPVGTWTVADHCDPSEALNRAPGEVRDCEELTAQVIGHSDTREWTITATTIKIGAGTRTTTTIIDFPLACVPPLDGESPTCDALTPAGGMACRGRTASECRCEVTEVDADTEEPLSVTFTGSTFTASEDGPNDLPGEYCVNGDLLYLAFHKQEGRRDALHILKRKP